MKSGSKKTLVAFSFLSMVFSYQNCGQGFSSEAISTESLASSSSPDSPSGGGGGSPTTTTTLPSPSDAGRRILKVCASGCPYTLPSQANAAAQDTDIIEVQAGTYNDCFSISRNGLKFRGVNGRAHLTTKMCGGKGSIVVYGTDTVIENFEFSEMAVADRNGAGIRHQGAGLIVRNSYFHDGENGILSSSALPDKRGPKDTILVENSRFEHLGGDSGHSHAVYFGDHYQITVKNSLFLASRDEGHEFKSRALRSTIDCSMMASLDGVDSYSLNFPDAGQVVVTNSVVEQGDPSVNSAIIDYGSEMLSNYATNTLSFNRVTVINDRNNGGTFFQVRNSTQFQVVDSMTVGSGTQYSSQQAMEQGTQHFNSRGSAGLSAYPNLPKPAACTGTIGLLN